MSLNKKSRRDCLKDHQCCLQHDRLKRQIQILQGKLKNTKQDLTLAERVNTKLLEEFNKYKGKSVYLYGLSVPFTQRVDYEKALKIDRQAFNEQIERIKQDYQRKERHMHMQIQRINQQAESRIMMLDHKHQVEAKGVQQEQWQMKNYIGDLETDIRNLRSTIHNLEKENRHLNNEKQIQIDKLAECEKLNKNLESEYVAIGLQMSHMKESLREMESKYEQLNKQLIVQRQLSKQAMLDSRGKQQQLAYFKKQLRTYSEGSERLSTKNFELQNMVDHLDEYAFEARKRESEYRRKMMSAHDFGLKKVRTVGDLKRSIERLRYR